MATQQQETTFVNETLTTFPPTNFTGMKLGADVRLGSLTFNTFDETNRIVWVVTDIEGWWTLPEPEFNDAQRSYGDGSFDIDGRWLARLITLKGVFLVDDPAKVPTARDILATATDLVYKGAWLIAQESVGTAKAAFVRLNGQPEITTVNARGRTEFSIPLKAADPIKYIWLGGAGTTNSYTASSSVTPPNTLSVTNAGTAVVPTRLTVTGPIASPAYITNTTTGKTVVIDQPLAGANTTGNVVQKQYTNGVVTLTTSTPHLARVGSQITVAAGVDSRLSGTYTVTRVPSSVEVQYNRTISTTVAIQSQALTVTDTSTGDSSVTITTGSAHGYSVGDVVFVTGIGNAFNGSFEILTVPLSTTFTYNHTRARELTYRSLLADTVTLTTSTPHGYANNTVVTVSGLGKPFDGSKTITAKSDYQFTYPAATKKTPSNVSWTFSGTVGAKCYYTVTLTFGAAHGFVKGDSITIAGVYTSDGKAPGIVNGNFSVSSSTSTTLTYRATPPKTYASYLRSYTGKTATYNTAQSAITFRAAQSSVRLADRPERATGNGYFVRASAGLSTSIAGTAQFVGIVPTTVSSTFTHGPDTIIIDSSDRSVSLNGSNAGARAVLTATSDWLYLNAGANSISFRDDGKTSGQTGTLKVEHRSGWLS
jgi:hypothetical protein